jgi:hypothetical protein
VTADVDHLHVKRIELVSFSYIVLEDNTGIFVYRKSCKEEKVPHKN